MMPYSYFTGCKIPYYLPEYGTSTLALLSRFGIELLELEFNCCGYPVRDIDFQSFLLAGARNLALKQMLRKLQNTKQAGADFVCTACTYCQMQFDQKNQSGLTSQDSGADIPAVLISQLIGLSIGMEDEEIGLGDENRQKLMVRA